MKPIVLRKVGTKWEIYLDVAAAISYGSKTVRVKKYASDPLFMEGLVPVVKTATKSIDFVPGGRPHKFTKKEALGLAHTIGYYMLGIGSFVSTYTEEITAPRLAPGFL